MFKINQVTTSQLHVKPHLENNAKNVEIKKINQTNDSFFNKFCQLFKNEKISTKQSNLKTQAENFLKSTFIIPNHVKATSTENDVSYNWDMKLIPYTHESTEVNNTDSTGISNQFIRDLIGVNYSIKFLNQSITESNDSFFKNNKYQYFNEFLTHKHMKKLSQIAHQGHLAIPRGELKLHDYGNYMISLSESNNDLKINIEKTEKNEYIITSNAKFNLRQIEPDVRFENTSLSVERKTYLSTDKNGDILEKQDQKDDLKIKITQKYN